MSTDAERDKPGVRGEMGWVAVSVRAYSKRPIIRKWTARKSNKIEAQW